MSCYVVMRRVERPNVIVIPTTVAVRQKLAEANSYVRTRKYPDQYYIRLVKDDTGPEERGDPQ